MKIVGSGVDLVELDRIEAALSRFGERFLDRVFTHHEIFYCQSMKDPIPHLAGRFAAKEAVSKVLGTGIGAACRWKDVEILRLESGKPHVVLHGSAKGTAVGMGIQEMHISLSHTKGHALAMAIASAA